MFTELQEIDLTTNKVSSLKRHFNADNVFLNVLPTPEFILSSKIYFNPENVCINALLTQELTLSSNIYKQIWKFTKRRSLVDLTNLSKEMKKKKMKKNQTFSEKREKTCFAFVFVFPIFFASQNVQDCFFCFDSSSILIWSIAKLSIYM